MPSMVKVKWRSTEFFFFSNEETYSVDKIKVRFEELYFSYT